MTVFASPGVVAFVVVLVLVSERAKIGVLERPGASQAAG